MATLLDARKKTSLPFKSLFIITPPFSQLRHGEDTSQESASQVSFNSSLPFGYHSNLTNYFFFFFFFIKPTGPETSFPISTATIPTHVLNIPNSYCDSWPLKKVFLAFSLSSPAPSTISIMSAPSLLFIILN